METAAIKAAIGDAVLTFLWMFCSATVGPLSALIAEAVGVKGSPLELVVPILLLAGLILAFNPISGALGQASFNPNDNIAFYVAGMSSDNLLSMALRFPAQALGAAAGVLAIHEVMPSQFKSMLQGPSLKVDLHTGAVAEGILTFIVTFIILSIVIKGPKNAVVKTLMITTTIVVMIGQGGAYTGPSMNPVNAYGWAYLSNSHNTWEHFYVYWIPPFIGATLAAFTFKSIFLRPAAKKVKKA